MHILSGEYFETELILLVGYGIPPHTSHHHLITLIEIVHYTFQLGHKCFLVYFVSINQLFCGNLNTNVALDEIKGASNLNRVKDYPHIPLFKIIPLLFEEKNFTRTPDCDNSIIYEDHLA